MRDQNEILALCDTLSQKLNGPIQLPIRGDTDSLFERQQHPLDGLEMIVDTLNWVLGRLEFEDFTTEEISG